MSHCKIICKKNRDTVLLANFTNGKVISSKADALKFGCYQHDDGDTKRNKKILVAETSKLSYVGQTFGLHANKTSHSCKNYVGVLDKNTGKMQICDAELFQMHPQNPDAEKEEAFSQFALPGKEAELSFRDKADLLTEAFGSNKKRKAMESRYRNKVEDKALEDSLQSSINTAVSQNLDMSSTSVSGDNASVSIPPYDKDANKAEDVYKLQDIITDVEMDSLTNPAKEFFDSNPETVKTWRTESRYPLFILNHLSTLPQVEKRRWEKAKCLMYLHYLITLFKMNGSDLKKKNPFPEEWPKPVLKQLQDRFILMMEGTGGGKFRTRCMPKRLKDKLASYILVLCLIIDEFTVEMSDLHQDLKIGTQRLITHFKALGCQVKISQENLHNGETFQIKTATLKVPLAFPEISIKQKKTRK